MKERRKFPRVDDDHEVTISIISKREKLSQKEKTNNFIKNLSKSGAKLQTNILLPVDTLLNVNFTLKTVKQKITAIAKVRWLKDVIEKNYYEAGVEFVSIPVYSRQTIEEYILRKIRKNET